MIYLDSCALVKLIVTEEETPALLTFIAARATEGRASSAIAQTEVSRALIRCGADRDMLAAAESVLDQVMRLRVTDPVLRAAGQLPMRHLRSLDAIHLASAEHLEHALSAFVTYDKRLAGAAAERSLPVESPGAPQLI